MNRQTLFACLLAAATLALPACAAPNLLTNPGFEDAAGWLHGWTVERADPAGELYYYHLRAGGGGHGDARPRTGAHALEIYSPNTCLRQSVTLSPGTYRLSTWARNNGDSGGPRLILALGEQQRRVPVLSDRYRRYYADFTVETAGTQRVQLVSTSLGIAVDDLALERLEGEPEPPLPYLFIDLQPSGGERSANVQTYLRGMKQWVDLTISCIDPQRLGVAELEVRVPETVRLSGINEKLLHNWRPFQLAQATVTTTRDTDEAGRAITSYRFPCPRFVNGIENPVGFGGFFVEVPSGKRAEFEVRIHDHGRLVSSERFQLVPLQPPARQKTPRLLKTLSYSVQDWKADLQGRLETTPRLFKLMGLNVWSEYQITRLNAKAEPTAEEQVMARAAREFGVREFWPNFSELLSGANGQIMDWGTSPQAEEDPDQYLVRADGSVDKSHFNMRYAANMGKAWVETALKAHQRTITRPRDLGLPYRHSGFITDALEGLYFSYDPATLADFARQKGIDPAEATVANVNGKYRMEWISYNNALYARVAANLAAALREVDPSLKVINTASPFGPIGSYELPRREQMEWARTYDYTMPQWYSLRYFGSLYSDTIELGTREKLYGRGNGYADVIPLLCNSMGTCTEDLSCIRFKVFDLISASPHVKGIGYYIGTNAFADARWMVGISRVHTLLADVEEYYAQGTRRDRLARFVKLPGGIKKIEGMDDEGRQTTLTPKVETACRVHTLRKGGRLALITLISHCNQRVGEKGRLRLDLKALGATPGKAVLFNHLTGKTLPLRPEITVDTNATGSLALLEVRSATVK